MFKKYVALRGTSADDHTFNKFKKSMKEAMDSALRGSDFNAEDSVVIYEVTFKPVKKGKITVDLEESG
jgi:hypothetical protein